MLFILSSFLKCCFAYIKICTIVKLPVCVDYCLLYEWRSSHYPFLFSLCFVIRYSVGQCTFSYSVNALPKNLSLGSKSGLLVVCQLCVTGTFLHCTTDAIKKDQMTIIIDKKNRPNQEIQWHIHVNLQYLIQSKQAQDKYKSFIFCVWKLVSCIRQI